MSIAVGIVGATGYTGSELLRLLALHPDVELRAATSRDMAGQSVAGLFQHLRRHVDLAFVAPESAALKECDAVFFATPNGTAMRGAKELLDAGVRVIDLSADFRLRDAGEWQRWYGMEHASPSLLNEAVYGLPEVNRAALRSARLVANPGCYPTAVQLGFLPLLERGLVDQSRLIADAKSGASGAGRKAEVGLLLTEASESFKAYGVAGHRHLPEISQGLAAAAGKSIGLTFVPHLTPMIRGIHATLYAELTTAATAEDLRALYVERYAAEPFVDVMEPGLMPETRAVRGSNFCRLSIFIPQGGRTVVVLSVIDNLVKGAAGQAVQNFNIMFGLDEQAGLSAIALQP
ncbi:MAG: N-acetyl-gamma-glutamyl-phosphate reductase [Chromatiales bacterium]|jgi:N-acetyl-gamma-glutamyl-phosphate reductase|nr:N-acetyl-gamma-glutamyl-phosphate reductase [Chromatiales bacterium]